MASFGNVFSWGAITEGKLEEVEALRGKTVARLATSGNTAAVLDASHNVVWLSPVPEEADAIQDVFAESKVSDLTFGKHHTLAIGAHGLVFGWGKQDSGQVGTGLPFDVDEPELLGRLGDNRVVQVGAGEAHSAALTDTGLVYMWGRNVEGQCGQGYASEKANATAGVVGQLMAPRFVHALIKTPMARVACGGNFTAAISRAGELWTWGEGGCGQLGIGRVTKRDRPVLVQERADDGSRYVDVVCGWAHAIGLTESQAVYTWGFNTMGQLGVGDLASRHTPTRVKELDPAVSEAKREELDAERKRVLSRGSSVTSARAFHPDTPYGQDKDNNPATGRPVEVHTLSPAQFLDHTVTHSLSITQRDALPNAVNNSLNFKLPEPEWTFPTPDFRAVRIAVGHNHSAAITAEGHLYTWGCSRDGRLGHEGVIVDIPNGDVMRTVAMPVRYPRMVKQLEARIVSAVSCSANSTFAIAGAALESILPVNGPLQGGSRLRLLGGGLAALASRNDGDDSSRQLRGVQVRFTRPAAPVDEADAEADEEAALAPGNPAYDSEDDADSEAVEKVVEVPAYTCEDGSGIECRTPAFRNPCEVTVEVVVDGTEVVPGSQQYWFYASPSNLEIECDAVPLMLPKDLALSGKGLFGGMLSHPSTKAAAQALIDEVEAKWNAEQEALQAAEDAAEAAALGLAAPMADAVVGNFGVANETKMIVLDEANEGETTESKAESKRAPHLPALELPHFELDKAIKLRAEQWDKPQGLCVQFTLLCNGEATDACLVVPATYNASYRDEPEEAKQTSVVADLSNPLDIADDDDSVVGPPGEFTASINCTFPSMEPSADIEAKRDAGECTLTLVLSIAPNGVDFVGACQIPAFSPTLDAVEPNAGCLTMSHKYYLVGKGFEKMAGTKAKFTAGDKSWSSPVKFEDTTRLSFNLPKGLKLPAVQQAIETGDGDDESKDEVRTRTVVPTVGCGEYQVELQLGKEMTSGKSVPFIGYVGEFGTLQPTVGPICGGTVVTVTLAKPEQPFLFDLQGQAHAKLSAKDFEAVVPVQLGVDPAADDYGTVKLTMPPRIVWPPPAPSADDVAAAEDDACEAGGEAKGGVGDGDAGEDEASADAHAVDDTAGEKQGEDGDEAEAPPAPEPRPKLKKTEVGIELTLNGTHYHKKLKFNYYDEEAVVLEGIEPAKQKAGQPITVTGNGVTKAMLGDNLIIRLQMPDEVLTVREASVGEEGGVVITLPDDIPLGACVVVMSFDGGQTWSAETPEEGAPTFTVSKK